MTNSQTGGGTPQNGPKLQILIDGGCIERQVAMELSPQQLASIEALSYAQIGTLVDVRSAVGPVMNSDLI
jgi:hypothetical protein